MSHFTVLVIGEDYEAALAPFQENTVGDCPAQYMEFNDVEDEHRESYETDTASMVRLADGTLVSAYDEQFKVDDPEESWKKNTVYPEGAVEVDVPVKEVYPTFESYMEDYCGYTKDEEKGRYGYYENSNAKWDWWSLGGRWSGMLKVKEGAADCEVGKKSFLDDSPAVPGWCDSCKMKDLDLAGMQAEAVAKAAERFDEVWNKAVIPSGGNICETWEHIRETMFPGDINAAREYYNNHPFSKIVVKAKLDSFSGDTVADFYLNLIDFKGQPIADVNPAPARDKYLEHAKATALSTFAVIKDGQWYEKGSMGWFGTVSDEKAEYDWCAQMEALLEDLPADETISVIDCHI